MSRALPQELLLHLILSLYIVNLLEVEGAVVCLHLSTQPTWPQPCACLVFCLLSFLHLLFPQLGFQDKLMQDVRYYMLFCLEDS
jgi:hypothetical protein